MNPALLRYGFKAFDWSKSLVRLGRLTREISLAEPSDRWVLIVEEAMGFAGAMVLGSGSAAVGGYLGAHFGPSASALLAVPLSMLGSYAGDRVGRALARRIIMSWGEQAAFRGAQESSAFALRQDRDQDPRLNSISVRSSPCIAA